MSVDSKMTAIADKIRGLLGLTGEMGLDAMETNLTTEQANIDAALAAIADKGVTVPDGSTSDALAALIESIEAGGGGNIVAGSFTPTSNMTTFKVNHNFNTKDICFVVFMSDNKAYVARGVLYSSFTNGRKSWMVYNNENSYFSQIFGNTGVPTITTESVDLTGFFYNSVFIGGSTYTYFVWKKGEV